MNREYSGYCTHHAEGVDSDAFGEAEAMKISITLLTIAAAVLSVALHPAFATDDPYLQKRATMVRDQIEREGVTDPRVLTAMRDVPRTSLSRLRSARGRMNRFPCPSGKGRRSRNPTSSAS